MRYASIEEHRDAYPVARMNRLWNVSRTGYLQWRSRPLSDRTLANATLDAQVAVIHAEARQSYDGVLAAQASARIDHAFRSWRPVRKQ